MDKIDGDEMAEFDAIVVGSGISGGWSAKELTERGLKVAMLHRGIDVNPSDHYSDHLAPWEHKAMNRVPEDERKANYPHVPGSQLMGSNRHFWASDQDAPYENDEQSRFEWIHGDTSGGKSLLWGRRCFRLGPQVFTANIQDGHGIDWPIRYEDIEPWYDKVEIFAGISGGFENLDHLPDSQFQPAFGMNDVEKEIKSRVEAAYPTRKIIDTRCAHLTQPTEEQMALGRGKCQGRNHCQRGCIFGAYFASVSSTIPAAHNTGNLTQIDHAIVHSVIYDDATKKATGVRYIDEKTGQTQTVTAKLIVLNASTIGTTMILQNSVSERFPNGLGNDSGELGRNIMDHVSAGGSSGKVPGFENSYYNAPRIPAGIYIPRFSTITEHDVDFVRGYGYQGGAKRTGWTASRRGIGQDLKVANRTPGHWTFRITAFGEVLPNPKNKMYLHKTKRDKWGIPLPVFDTRMGENELKMMQNAKREAASILEAAGCVDIVSDIPETLDDLTSMGNRIHEMGTARMGRDPATSVLNGWNQVHAVPNLIVSDGACMTSAGCVNPSLTYMALAARSAHHAVDLMEEGAL